MGLDVWAMADDTAQQTQMEAEMTAQVGWSQPRRSDIEKWKLVFEEVLGWIDLQEPYMNRHITADDMRDFLGYVRVRASDEWVCSYDVRNNQVFVA